MSKENFYLSIYIFLYYLGLIGVLLLTSCTLSISISHNTQNYKNLAGLTQLTQQYVALSCFYYIIVTLEGEGDLAGNWRKEYPDGHVGHPQEISHVLQGHTPIQCAPDGTQFFYNV